MKSKYKFDNKMLAFTGREGSGAIGLELVLAPYVMVGLESMLSRPLIKVVRE